MNFCVNAKMCMTPLQVGTTHDHQILNYRLHHSQDHGVFFEIAVVLVSFRERKNSDSRQQFVTLLTLGLTVFAINTFSDNLMCFSVFCLQFAAKRQGEQANPPPNIFQGGPATLEQISRPPPCRALLCFSVFCLQFAAERQSEQANPSPNIFPPP